MVIFNKKKRTEQSELLCYRVGEAIDSISSVTHAAFALSMCQC